VTIGARAPSPARAAEELVDLLGILVASPAVEEDEDRPPLVPIVAGRQHHVHGQASADRSALDREVLDGCAGGVGLERERRRQTVEGRSREARASIA
jgi:hypothetical protein